MRNFTPRFPADLEKANETMEKIAIPDEITTEKCPICGANLVIKDGRFGKFMACPNYNTGDNPHKFHQILPD